jgi:hypothetical protein
VTELGAYDCSSINKYVGDTLVAILPDKPKVPIPQRKNMAILGTESKQRIKLDSKTQEEEDEFELNARNKWKKQESQGHGSVYSMQQKKNAPAVDETFICKRIEVVISFDMNKEGTEQAQLWCSGVVERICDGTWVIPGKMRKC